MNLKRIFFSLAVFCGLVTFIAGITSVSVMANTVSESISETVKKSSNEKESRSVSATGTWGTVPWSYDQDAGVLTLTGGGKLGEESDAPWAKSLIPNGNLLKIVITQPIEAPVNSSYLFYSKNNTNPFNLRTIEGLDKLDTSKVTDMSYMFAEKWYLSSLDLSKFNTSKVATMQGMFRITGSIQNTVLETLDLSNFDTSNVTDMSYMFDSMTKISYLDFSNFNTSKVTTMQGMFSNLNYIRQLDISSFDTSKVTDMSHMFFRVGGKLPKNEGTNLTLGEKFITSEVTTMNSMFNQANIQKIDLSNAVSTTKVTDMQLMFNMCGASEINLAPFNMTGSVNTYGMFLLTQVSKLTLGKGTNIANTGLPLIKSSGYTGNWVKYKYDGDGNPIGVEEMIGDSNQFMSASASGLEGTYEWESVGTSNPDVKFKIKRNQNTASIVDLSIASKYSGYANMIEVRTPLNMTIRNFSSLTQPSGWGEQYQNSSTDQYHSYSFVSNKEKDLTKIINFLQSLQFDITSPVDKEGQVEIVLNSRTITSFTDDKGVPHYYEYIPYTSVGGYKSWQESYNLAKTYTYKGLTGYLATITSKEEQDHIYNNIAKEAGWLGGTRAVRAGSNLRLNDESTIPTTINEYNINVTQANKWYWVNGPETGVTFYNTPMYSSYGPVTGVYEYFKNWTNGANESQPDNHQGTEAFLQFAHVNDPRWNDLSMSSGPSNTKGFYVEYSAYGSQTEIADTSMTYSAKVPQPIIVKYKNKDGQTIQGDTTFGLNDYLLGTVLLDEIKGIDGYMNPTPLIDDTNKSASLPFVATDKPQYITIYWDRAEVNVTISYVDKTDNTAIYAQADKDASLKKTDQFTMTIGSNLTTNLEALFEEGKLSIDYYGYDKVSLNSYERSDGKTDTVVPGQEVTLTYKYTPQTKFISVPEYIQYGSVDVASLLFNNHEFWPKKQVTPIEIVNTNKNKNWKLQAKMEQNMQRESDGLNMYGKLEFNKMNGSKVLLGSEISNVISETELTGSVPLKNISVDDKNTSSLSVNIFDINSQAKETGTYKGKIGWYLVDAP